jgi:hypothetical protein
VKTPAEGRPKKTSKGQVKKTAEGRVKKTPDRVEQRPLQRGTNEDSRGSCDKDSSRGSSKEDRPILPSGKRPHDINSVTV